MTSRKDLPRCKTCKHWDKLDWSKGGNYGKCDLIEWGEDWAVPKYFGCIQHSDYDEPETQTEADDDMRR